MVISMNKTAIIVTDRAVYIAAGLPTQEPQRAIAAGESLKEHDDSGLSAASMLSTAATGSRGMPSPQQIVDAARFWSEATGLPIYDMRRNRTIAISDPAVLG